MKKQVKNKMNKETVHLLGFYDDIIVQLYRLIEEIEKAQYKSIDEKQLQRYQL